MDIDLLSRMVREIILDNDQVALPGVGVFVAEIVPSTFSDKGYTINPPYRRLSFRQDGSASSLALAELYSKSNKVSLEDAGRIVAEFVGEMQDILQKKKTVVLPGLGRLRATKENNFFFVPDEDMDIWPESLGLEPVSLKFHEESAEQISTAVAELGAIWEESAQSAPQENAVEETPIETSQQIIETPPAEETTEVETKEIDCPVAEEAETAQPSVETVVNEEVATEQVAEKVPTEVPATESVAENEEVKEPTAEDVKEASTEDAKEASTETTNEAAAEAAKAKRSGWWKFGISVAVAAGLAAVVIGAYTIVGRTHPGIFDSFLYSPEELEILHDTSE